MSHLLHPQLPLAVANALARELVGLSVAQLESRAGLHHDKATYSATGGARIGPQQHKDLISSIRRLRASPDVYVFDVALGRLLHEQMRLSRGEASLDGIWAFLGCVALPDVVRWRFAGEGATPVERFVGGSRGVRSVFGRCWWRGELLYDESNSDPYWLLGELTEDELTGIIDRQRMIVSRHVAVTLAHALVKTDTQKIPRPTVGREVFKRYLRLSAFVGFETLRRDELEIACDSICARAVKALLAAKDSGSA